MPGTTLRTHPTLREVLQALAPLLDAAGDEKVASLRVDRDVVVIHPADLGDGVSIARALGLTAALDRPPFIDWVGEVAGLQVHVQAELCSEAGQSR